MALGYKAISLNEATAEGTTTLTLPTNTIDGDYLIASVQSNAEEHVTTVPSGWTELSNGQIPSSNGWVYNYYKLAASEPASWDWVWDLSAGSKVGFCMSIEGQSVTDPLGNSATGLEINQTTFNSVTDLVMESANSLLIMILAVGENGGGGVSAYAIATSNPTWTERAEITNSGHRLAVATANRPESTNTGVWSATIGGASADCFATCFAINPQNNTTVSTDTLTVTTSVIDTVTVTGSAAVSADSVTATVSVQEPTVTTPEAMWTEQNQSSTTWTNQDQS